MATTDALSALGDVKAALAGRRFGDSKVASTALAVSPAVTTVDCAQGETFAFKMRATSVFKLGNPTNADTGSEIHVHISGITTFGTLVFDSAYAVTGAFATFSTAKVKSIGFKWNPLTAKWTETYRTTSKTG